MFLSPETINYAAAVYISSVAIDLFVIHSLFCPYFVINACERARGCVNVKKIAQRVCNRIIDGELDVIA